MSPVSRRWYEDALDELGNAWHALLLEVGRALGLPRLVRWLDDHIGRHL